MIIGNITIKKYGMDETAFTSEIDRYGVNDNKLSASLCGGITNVNLQKNTLYQISITLEDQTESFSGMGIFLYYSFNAGSTTFYQATGDEATPISTTQTVTLDNQIHFQLIN